MSASDWNALTPVNVVTGFLGSGKTTLLRELLRSPRLAGTAVLVNEFGEVGLDHHLLEAVTESTLLLENGCVCCAVRDDLRSALLDLHGRRERGEVPRYDRVVLETSGLADPAPVLHTLTADAVLRHHYRPGTVVTVVDAVNAAGQLDRHPESVRQAALADRLILTKTDLAEASGTAALRARLRSMNPAAPLTVVRPPGAGPEGGEASSRPDAVALLVEDVHGADGRRTEAERWLGLAPAPEEAGLAGGGPAGAPAEDAAAPHDHTHGVESFSIDTEGSVDWNVFGIWLGMLLHCHGENVLRVKGILDVPELAGPVLLNAVQHTVHPPSHLPSWPKTWERRADGTWRRGSRIVFITHGLDRARVERSLAAFRRALDPSTPVPWEPAPPAPGRSPPTRSERLVRSGA